MQHIDNIKQEVDKGVLGRKYKSDRSCTAGVANFRADGADQSKVSNTIPGWTTLATRSSGTEQT